MRRAAARVPPPNQGQRSVLVKMTASEREEIAAACARMVAGIAGARMPVGTYMLGAALALARGELVRRLPGELARRRPAEKS